MRLPRAWNWLLLFTTSSTLVCCAIPIALVSLGLGATVATMVRSAPWIVVLSQHKLSMFFLSGVLIVVSAWFVYRSGRSCPVDPELAVACQRADRWNRRFIWGSAGMWAVGCLAAYGLPLLQ